MKELRKVNTEKSNYVERLRRTDEKQIMEIQMTRQEGSMTEMASLQDVKDA